MVVVSLMSHNWQKWKSTFLVCSCHKVYREKANGSKFQLCFKKYDFCEYVKFGAISWKFDCFFINSAQLKVESKNSFAHNETHVILINKCQMHYTNNLTSGSFKFTPEQIYPNGNVGGGGTDLERGYGDVRPWRPPFHASPAARKGPISSKIVSSQDPLLRKFGNFSPLQPQFSPKF